MKSSDNSSSATISNSPKSSAKPRRRFALSGRSTIVDPRTQPVRRDLAAIELADRVFAPHYAKSVMRSAVATSAIRQSSRLDSERLGALAPGDAFELYELSSEQGWGRSVASGIVGFVDAAALGPYIDNADNGAAQASAA